MAGVKKDYGERGMKKGEEERGGRKRGKRDDCIVLLVMTDTRIARFLFSGA